MKETSESPHMTSANVSRQRQWPSVVLSVVISILTISALLGGSTLVYLEWLNGRPMHGVTYLGLPLALTDEPTRRAIVEQANQAILSRSITVLIDGRTVAVPLAEFQPRFNTDAVVAASAAIGQRGEHAPRTEALLRTLWSGTRIDPVVSLTALPTVLAEQAGNQRLPTDARFRLVDGGITVEPATIGRTLLIDQLYADVTSVLSSGALVSVQFDEVAPAITTDALTALAPIATAMVNGPLTLQSGRVTLSYQPSELLSWVRPSVGIDGTVELTVDQLVVGQSLESIEKRVNRSAQPRQLSTRDGSVLTEGRAGSVVNRAETVARIIAELERRRAGAPPTAVAVAVRTVEPTEQHVEPDTTPGLYTGKYVEVDLSSQRLYQYEGETLVGQYRVSTGKWTTPTPIGSFAINTKVERAYSRPYELYMPYWMAFIGSSYGLHELPEWADGSKEGQNHLGRPVSHGCIRLGIGDAERIYEWVEIGTPIVVHT